MHKIKYFYFFIIIILPALVIFPQQGQGSTKTNRETNLYKSMNESITDDDSDFLDVSLFGAPTVSIVYGLSQMSIRDFGSSFADPGLIELKLGHTTEKSAWGRTDIVRYKFGYLFLSNFDPDLRGSSHPGSDLITNMWRFGLGWAKGYGYRAGSISIVPYYATSFSWSRVQMGDQPSLAAEKLKTDLFNETFRFGSGAEGGIKIRIIKNLTLEAGYERSIIFLRHLFWKWAGSAIIEAASQWALDEFIDEIMGSSPHAGVIANFVLKNALSYGIYELRQEKMNWPFSSEAPFSYDQFKFGVTFTF